METVLGVTVSGQRLSRAAGVVMCGVTFSNVVWACYGTVTCEEYLPSLSYIAAFQGHDRTAVAVSVFYSVFLSVFFTGVFAVSIERVSAQDRGLMLGIGLGICGFVPVIAVFDGHIGLYGMGMRDLHYFSLYFLVILTLTWLCLAFSTVSKRLPLLKWCLMTAVLLVITLMEWELSNSAYQGALFNQTFFAFSQWSTVFLAFFLPAKVCEAYGDFEVHLELKTVSF